MTAKVPHPGRPDDRSRDPGGPESDEATALYRRATRGLVDGLDRSITGWIIRITEAHLPQELSADRRMEVRSRVREVAERIHAEVTPKLRALLEADVEAQSTNPLGLFRASVGAANGLLTEVGVTPPTRDPVAESMFPDDLYDLGPANFDDVDPALHDLGLTWGAAKAHVVLTRRRH